MSFDAMQCALEEVMADAYSHRAKPAHIERDCLISKMLQDRNVLRVISAPHGFGKTELAREYARRLFSGKEITWIDGNSPDFLLSLDEAESSFGREGSAALVVLDNLPWLHEQRAQALSRQIDTALYSGIEVIVTMLPSCDCLTGQQTDFLPIYAADLLVSERECAPRSGSVIDESERGIAMKRWRDAGMRLFGRVPSVIWGERGNARVECLRGLFSENLPLSVMKCMLAMLLLESGNVRDLEKVGAGIRRDDEIMLARDYPVFGIDQASGGFEVAQFQLEDLRQVIADSKLDDLIFDGNVPLHERVMGQLFKNGNSVRGSQIIRVFCSDERCAAWLAERGWSFLDAGNVDLVSNMLARCPEHMYVQSPSIQAIHAWLAGMSGNGKEACHIARRVLGQPASADLSNVAGVAARLALALFDKNAILEQDKVPLASSSAPVDSVDFLACVIDGCTNVEIARAFRLEGAEKDDRYEKARRLSGKKRAKALEALFTEHAFRFKDDRAFHLALHLLAHVDDPSLKRLVQELGCESIVGLRRCGISTFSSAALVRDMWHVGYFGLTGPIIDRRDAKILDGASRMLNELAKCCGLEFAHIPWEAKGSPIANGSKQARQNAGAQQNEGMYVKLFGGFEVTIGGIPIALGKMRKKSRTLLTLLVLHQGRDVLRDDIFEQLWPGVTHVHALDNFYTVWSNCIAALGDSSYLVRNGEYCRIDTRLVHSDVAEFDQLTRHLITANHDSNHLLDTYAKIEVLYRGSLTPCESSIWMINGQRERYQALYVDSMVAATDCALGVRDTRIALWFARKAMEEDQSREDVYRALMKAQIASGQRCQAIKTYLKCRDFLRDAYGLDPSLETRELYDTLVTTDPELLRLDSASFLA